LLSISDPTLDWIYFSGMDRVMYDRVHERRRIEDRNWEGDKVHDRMSEHRISGQDHRPWPELFHT
jgi:hypothetical protein